MDAMPLLKAAEVVLSFLALQKLMRFKGLREDRGVLSLHNT